ncbi:MAG: hypothetical protein WA823_06265 [Candidatus Acidiferrales bacterium]
MLALMNAIPWRLFGESIREIGVLILVFVPLDIWITPSRQGLEPRYPSWLTWLHGLTVDHWRILIFGIGGLVVLYFGIKIKASATAMEAHRGND